MGVAVGVVVGSTVHIALMAPVNGAMNWMVTNEMAEYLTVLESACLVVAASLARLLWLDGRAAGMIFWYWACSTVMLVPPKPHQTHQ
jgi:Ca2+/H+ antiporter